MEQRLSSTTRVFLVEDNVAVRERLSELLLKIDGVSIVGEADSPAAAVEGILRTLPDSVVLDLQLIGGSGLEVLRKVHPRVPEIVFIVLTNQPDPGYRRACMGAGASYFFDKAAEFAKAGEIIAGLGATRH